MRNKASELHSKIQHMVAWTTCLLAMLLAFGSTSSKTSFTQAGRNLSSRVETRVDNLERHTRPLDNWGQEAFGSLEQALATAPALQPDYDKNDEGRQPSSLGRQLLQ